MIPDGEFLDWAQPGIVGGQSINVGTGISATPPVGFGGGTGSVVGNAIIIQNAGVYWFDFTFTGLQLIGPSSAATISVSILVGGVEYARFPFGNWAAGSSNINLFGSKFVQTTAPSQNVTFQIHTSLSPANGSLFAPNLFLLPTDPRPCRLQVIQIQ